VTAAIAGASAPVSVESAAAFAANMPGSELARPVDADAAGAGAVFDEPLSMFGVRAAGLAAARTAALLINGVDSVSAALPPAGGFGAEFTLIAATEAFKPAAASEGAVAPCAMSVGACGVSMPPLFGAAVVAAAEGAAASPPATSAAGGCGVAPADPTGAVTDIDPALDDGREMGGAATAVAVGIGASTAVAAGVCDPAAGDPAAGDPAAGAPAAGGNGDGEDLPATGRWPPLGSTPVGVCAAVLRLGFAPASFNALAKSWLWSPIAAEFAPAAVI
jgi:hypothetical protein